MVGHLFAVLVCLTGAVPEGKSSPDADYEAQKAAVGRDAASQVQLALWCEAHGLEKERLKHLAIAVLSDPANATARGLLGLVQYQGKWIRPDSLADKVRSDSELSEALAQYNTRRASMKGKANEHYALANWCEAHGLRAEAMAHYSIVTRLEPSRDAAWKHLGCKKYQGVWMTESQIATMEAETDAQRRADRHWKPILEKYKLWLTDKRHRVEAETGLAKVNDPRAIRSIWAVFGMSGATGERVAVGLLGQIDAPNSSRGLAMLAVGGASPEVRRVAYEILKRRDPRDVVDLLIGMIRTPMKFEVRPVAGPGTAGVLFVEGERYNVRRVYEAPAVSMAGISNRFFAPGMPYDPYASQQALNLSYWPNASIGPASSDSSRAGGLSAGNQLVADSTRAALERDGLIAQQVARNIAVARTDAQMVENQLESDVRSVKAMNATITETNERVLPILGDLTNQEFGAKPEAWQKWWTDQKGYAYVTPLEPAVKPTYEFVLPLRLMLPHNSCFAAGTPVRTLVGLKPIESLQAGDQVFVQDIKTGAVKLQPIVAIHHNPPNQTYRVSVDGETIAATGIHRFWKAGHGWTMARDLKPGDVIRTLGATARVSRVDLDATPRPVFNLEVAEGRSFFVGQVGALVHDNSLVESTPESFKSLPAASTSAP
jgi:hypothetical protein